MRRPAAAGPDATVTEQRITPGYTEASKIDGDPGPGGKHHDWRRREDRA